MTGTTELRSIYSGPIRRALERVEHKLIEVEEAIPTVPTIPAQGQLPVYANAAARDAAIPSPTPGRMCQLTDTNWLWWYRSAAIGWVPVQATIDSTSYSWGGWGTVGAVSPPAQANIGAYFFDNQLYTTATGAKYPGRYTLMVRFAASSSDNGYFTIMASMGGALNTTSSQMNWAVATATHTHVLTVGQAILFQFNKNPSSVAWATSTIALSLHYEAA